MTLHASSLGRGHRDDRRRRLLSEDLTANSSLPAGETPAGQPKYQPPTHKSENYGDSEFLQTQARLTDLVPRRLVPYLLCLKGGLAIIAGLMAFYVWAPKLIPDGQPASQLADLGKCGSLGNWFASLLLLMATALAGMIFSVRRHKVDDYRGHYRVWLWVATAWFLAATDAAANLHQGFQQLMVSLTSWRLAGEGSLWWVGAVLLFAGPIGFRLFMDMRSSRLSTAALLLAATAYLTALTAFFHGIVLQGQVVQRLLMEGSLLGGHLLATISMGLHARYVILDAEGVLPRREKKAAAMKRAEKADKKARRQRAEKLATPAAATTDDSAKDLAASTENHAGEVEQGQSEAKAKASGDKWVAIDPPHSGLQPAMKRMLSEKPTATAIPSPAGAASDSASDDSKLSKADRKAIKKRLLDERLKREQRKAANW